MQHVFIYGTLRAGEINDINRAAERHGIPLPQRLGVAYVTGRLFDFGRYPGLVLDPERRADPRRRLSDRRYARARAR